MAVNLIRNTRVLLLKGEAVDQTTGELKATLSGTFDESTVFEIQVLDGFSFSQNTTSDTITLNEAGDSPIRGQRTFNTALDPVEFSFSTYLRPERLASTIADATPWGAEEDVLWAAISSSDGTGWTDGASSDSDPVTAQVGAQVKFDNSDAHQLQKFVLIMGVDNDSYILENCVLDQATLDFGIDAIATIQWTGRAARLIRNDAKLVIGDNGGSVSGPITATAHRPKDTAAHYLANKLSAVSIQKNGPSGPQGPTYGIPLTGGSLTIANNVTYLTPANLGVVNQPITYFTGTRAISGSLNAYLKTGAGGTSDLLGQLLADSDTTTEPNWDLNVHIGGNATAPLRVHLDMGHTSLQIPTISSESVVSTSINFTAQGWSTTNSAFDVEQTNELVITYYTPEY